MQPEISTRAKIGKVIAAAAITLAGVAAIAAVGSRATSNDYIEYWSSGKLFIEGANPYSGTAILELERNHGFFLSSPLIMLNPPWALPLVALLGVCSERVGLVLWILCAAACIAASISLVGVPQKYRLIAFVFAPVIGTFLMMQSSPFLLLGVALFLWFHRQQPFAAGAALALMAIKPHLFLVFWVVLLAQSIYRKNISMFAGMFTALAAGSALVTLRVPSVWRDYLALMRNSALDHNYFPTLPTLLRVTINVNWTWLSLLPSVTAIIWALAYFWKNRSHWHWHREGALVMLVTILTSPYSWASDQLVLLPALAYAISAAPRRYAMESLIGLNTAAIVLMCLRSQACIWLPLGWLLWYLYAIGWKTDAGMRTDPISNEPQIEAVS